MGEAGLREERTIKQSDASEICPAGLELHHSHPGSCPGSCCTLSTRIRSPPAPTLTIFAQHRLAGAARVAVAAGGKRGGLRAQRWRVYCRRLGTKPHQQAPPLPRCDHEPGEWAGKHLACLCAPLLL